MFWPEPAIAYVSRAGSYDADPGRARPMSVCPSKTPTAPWARATLTKLAKLSAGMSLKPLGMRTGYPGLRHNVQQLAKLDGALDAPATEGEGHSRSDHEDVPRSASSITA